LTYKLVYTKRAEKDIKRLDAKIKERIGRLLLVYKEEPLRYASSLTDSRLGDFRFRIGDYRVVFDLKQDEIIILRIGHRKEIYKRG
jgi:mRNA interferase RelE/StbE